VNEAPAACALDLSSDHRPALSRRCRAAFTVRIHNRPGIGQEPYLSALDSLSRCGCASARRPV